MDYAFRAIGLMGVYEFLRTYLIFEIIKSGYMALLDLLKSTSWKETLELMSANPPTDLWYKLPSRNDVPKAYKP
jgi:hypothetical protein